MTIIASRTRLLIPWVALTALGLVFGGCGDTGPTTGVPLVRTATPLPPTNAEMKTDAAALSAAASEFDGISNELKSAISRVDSTAGELATHLQGPAGVAAQAAFQRFREAATKQVNELNSISQNINQSGVQYQQAADDAASSLGEAVLFSSSDSLSYNFSGIEGAAGAVQGQVANIQGLLDQGSQCLKKLASVWGGAGSDAYQVTQQRWDSTAMELNAALMDLSNKIGEAGSGMQQTESGVGGMFN